MFHTRTAALCASSGSQVCAIGEPDGQGQFARLMSQLNAVLELVIGVLGRDDVIGAYPHGSAVLGVLRPQSDLDVVILAERPTTEVERRCITDGLLAISGRRRRHPDDRRSS